ncbi:MAG: D-alanine--D-alanine ligase [Candidatus Latescibacteria bacterium]|nr:D-alanine--D-alanine ligase [Candidatus Latescibacterota bacterium]
MKIVVLMGGTSAEREVSLATGEAMASVLATAGHDVRRIDTAFGAKQLPEEGASHHRVGLEPPRASDLPQAHGALAIDSVKTPSIAETDVVFLALHGGFGENGGVQAVLDMLGVAYTGSGPLASAAAMDKDLSKRLFLQAGVPTPPWFLLKRGEDLSGIEDRVRRAFGFPCVVKPNDQGSSVGMTIVADPKDLPDALRLSEEYGEETLLERYIPGRELTVSILEGYDLPVIEIVPNQGVYDYTSKYTAGRTRYVVPADIPDETAKEAKRQGLKAFQALKCRDYARVDFRLSPEGEIFCLEVNTLPGMTATSLVPKAAAAAGIAFPDLCNTLAEKALKRK